MLKMNFFALRKNKQRLAVFTEKQGGKKTISIYVHAMKNRRENEHGIAESKFIKPLND